MIGLDSNNVNSGPSSYQVGARVCNTGDATATNVVATFVFDTANANINLTGSGTDTFVSLAAGACTDAYFNVDITRTVAAFDTARGFHVSVSATGLPPVSTPVPRELYVEHLISQNRNSVASVTGPTTVFVGQTYTYTVASSTATQGYEQLESFLNFPNVIFELRTVAATYSAPAGATNDKIYADACGWDPVPTSATYRSCIGPANYTGGKAGGTINTIYTVKILSTGTTTLTTLIRDFSGSSYHYNSDYGTGVNSITVTAVNPPPDLTLAKSHSGNFTVGAPGTYNFTVSNIAAPPGDTTGTITVTDTLPTGMTFASATGAGWTCGGTTTVTCTNPGPILAGGSSSFSVTVDVALAAAGSPTNTASVSTPGETVTTNNSASDPTTVDRVADLVVAKTDGQATAVPGSALVYVVTVTNSGPTPVVGGSVTDSMPAALTGVTWTCAASAGSTCSASGSGNIADTVNLLSGGVATYTVSGTVSPNATGSLANTASAAVPAGYTDPNPANNSATDTDTLNPTADLSIVKTDGQTSAVPGQAISYTVTVTNSGPSSATGATVVDNVPGTITGVTWTCAASAGSSCGAASGSGSINSTVNLAPTGTATYTVQGTVGQSATGSLSNTATVTAPAGVTDPNLANNTSTDTDSLTPTADLVMTKDDSKTTAVAGTSDTYTITVHNNGPSAESGASVVDNLPAALTGATWTCAASGGSSCGAASGSGSINTTADLLSGGTATYTLTATISAAASGNLSNTATVTAPAGVTDPNLANNSATDTDTLTASADLAITKTDGSATAVPGNGVTYTIAATNNGPSAVTAATVTDTVPVSLTSVAWTCAASAGSSCGAASGSGSINTTANLLVGGVATYTLTATVDPTATGTLTNIATVAPPGGVTDPSPANNSASDADTLTPQADLSVVKSDGQATVNAGDPDTYTITVGNAGPSAVSGAAVADTLPAALMGASWTCTASAGSSCGAASGSGNINTTVNLLPGGSAVYTLNVTVSSAASGTLSNTATITPPGGVTDPNNANNSSTDTDNVVPAADLAITKTDGQSTAVPGSPVTYTIVATDNGPTAVVGATIVDSLPASLSGATWTCTASAGSSCGAASGSGNINTTANLLNGGTATFSLTAALDPAATGTLTNTATVTAPGGINDPNPANNSATDTDTLVPTADLQVLKTGGTAVPGNPITYTITATDAGPSSVVAAPVVDNLPAALSAASWTCAASAGSSCAAASGSGNINTSVSLIPSGTATFSLTATIDPNSTGTLANTATITPPAGVTDPNMANNTSTASSTLLPQADLTIVKTDGQANAVPGSTDTYTITAHNNGPSSVTGATLTDNLPPTLSGATWTCAASAGSSCGAASGSGSISTTANLLSGGTVTYTLAATISATATGTLSNTASIAPPAGVTDPNPANNTSTDTDNLTPVADLGITKTDGTTQVSAGQNVTYTIVATNSGPSAVTAATVTDNLPGVLGSATWTCTASAGSSCGSASGTGNINASVSLLVGGTATFSLDANLSLAPSGTVSNTASVAPPGGTTDPNPSNDSATDTDNVVPAADLSITKTDGQSTAVPGTTVTYSIVATNNGPTAVSGAPVVDNLPAALTGASWTCTASAGSSCAAASGSGSINTTVNLINGGTATFALTATINSTATVNLANTATVATPAGIGDPNPANNTAIDTDTLTPQADLSITKTDGVTSVVPGTSDTYTIVASNGGPSAVSGATIADNLPAGLTGATWTCVASAGSSCGAGSGSGSISTNANLLVGGTATFTLTATVDQSATGQMVNTATVTAPVGVVDPNTTNNSATDTDSLTPQADLSITKTDGKTTAVPGTADTYTIVATNGGPSAVVGATVTDTLPGTLTGATWTCVASAGSSCGAASGTGSIGTTVNLLSGGTATFALTAMINPSASGQLINQAMVTVPNGVTDPNPANNSATDTDALGPSADLAITKTDGAASAVPGTIVVYTVLVTDNGPAAAAGATVTDTLPATLTGATWTCAASAGSTCAAASGTGSVNTTVDLLNAGTATFTITATVVSSATGTLVNTAAVAVPPTVVDPNPGNNSATDTDNLTPQADLALVKTHAGAFVVGRTGTFMLTVTDNGPSDSAAPTVVDTLPAGLTFSSGGNAAWACSAAGQVVTCTASGPLGAGASSAFLLTVDIALAALPNVTNSAQVSSATTDSNPANNGATDEAAVTFVDIAVVKTLNGSLVAGAQAVYTLALTNAGTAPTFSGITVTDDLPGVLSFVSATGSGWTCSAAGQVVTCTSAEVVDPGVSMPPITLTVNVANDASGSVLNHVLVSTAGDVNSANDTASASAPVTPLPPALPKAGAGPASLASPGRPEGAATILLWLALLGAAVAVARSVQRRLGP